MRLSFCLLTALCALTCFAQTTAPIKGHVIGEPFSAFLAKMSGGTEYLSACRKATTKKQARHFHVNLETCSMIIAAGDRGTRIRLNIEKTFPAHQFFADNDYAVFSGGKLVAMDLFIGRDRKLLMPLVPRDVLPPIMTYGAVLASANARFGPPEKTATVNLQNVYGAQLDYPVAEWDMNDLYVKIQALDLNADTPVTEMLVMTQAEFATEYREQLSNQRDPLQ